jgi:ADP-dependent NAD(P)H-hydrate dehydratase / NAD(P)H-hydrate epimerase
MHELLSPNEMARCDAEAIRLGTPGFELMLSAGRAVAEIARRRMTRGRRVLVLAGTGNNGGDGFVAAESLRSLGFDVRVAILGDPAKIRGDARRALDFWNATTLNASSIEIDADLIIDALFGAGLARELEGAARDFVQAMNDSGIPIVSIDLPSGVNGESGVVRGIAVRAVETVTFFRLKPGHLLYPGRAMCGRITLAQIGIPDTVLDVVRPIAFRNAPALWRHEYPLLSATDHKYDRGHAVVVSGGATRTGAARLSARAALRMGAGLVTVASPASALLVNAAHLTAIMLTRCDGADDLAGLLEDARLNALLLGPALGKGETQRDLVLAAIDSRAALILDADALTLFEKDPQRLCAAIARREAKTVLTPHDGEFARLFPELSESPKLERCRKAAQRSGATVILKGADTVIASPEGRAAINDNAPAWLATAGSGDVLAGVVTGLLAQGMPAFEAACAAVWFHGEAGRHAGPGLIAEDLDAGLREAIARYQAKDRRE